MQTIEINAGRFIMPGKLVAEDGLLKGLELPLPAQEGEEREIGRDPTQVQLVLADPAAAPQHLRVRRVSAGIEVEAITEEFPVLLNGNQLMGTQLLQTGDQLQVGGTLFRYEEEAAPTQPPAATAIEEEEPERKGGGSAAGTLLEAALSKAPAAAAPATDDIFPAEEAVKYAASEQSTATVKERTDEHTMDTIFQEAKDGSDGMLAEVNFDLLETGRWLLKVIGGPNNGAEFALQANSSYLIGTDPNSCDIIFHDTSVSRQHARITISDEDTLVIEDLRSRNGTLVEGRKIEGREELPSNVVVTLGTTSFIVFDREGEMQTVISPMLPSIVKVLQQEEANQEPPKVEPEPPPVPTPIAPLAPKRGTVVGAFLLTAAATGVFVLIGLGTLALFRSEPVQIEQAIDYDKLLDQATKKAFPDMNYSFNPSTGRLLLVGHVLTAADKDQLRYNLAALPFVTNVDDKTLIDETFTSIINPMLARNPAWRGVTIQTPKPGQFVLSGYLKTRDQADRLSEYISANFPNLDHLQRNIIVDEDIINAVEALLQKAGIRDVRVQMDNNEVTLSGGLPPGKDNDYKQIVEQVQTIPGVRSVRSNVSVLPPEATLVNISSRYRVSGVSNQGGVNLTVVINGRILTRGDVIEGMTITSIKPNVIFLEKDGIKYRIDY